MDTEGTPPVETEPQNKSKVQKKKHNTGAFEVLPNNETIDRYPGKVTVHIGDPVRLR